MRPVRDTETSPNTIGDSITGVPKPPASVVDKKTPDRGPHGYADMNIFMDISMNLTDMNTIIFSWIISVDISVLLKFHEYGYGYAPKIHEYSWIYVATCYEMGIARYLSSNVVEFDEKKEDRIYTWWRGHADEYPRMKIAIHDSLAIPVAERLFNSC